MRAFANSTYYGLTIIKRFKHTLNMPHTLTAL
jgi:hypothetical protein